MRDCASANLEISGLATGHSGMTIAPNQLP
jgi:hypothetical protein